MTRLSIKALTLIAFVFGISSQAAKADVDLTDGIRAFICDGESVVLFETDAGWVITIDPTAELVRTKNGWRHEDRSSGQVWYLREEERNSWIVEMLSEDGYLKFDCVDIAQSVSEVVTLIKPRLDENIAQTENSLADLGGQIKSALLKISTLEMENKMVLAKLEKTKSKLRIRQDEYAAMKSKLTDNPAFNLAELERLVEMAPSERHVAIKSSNLGSNALNQGGLLAICVRTLRDKAKMSSGCKDRIIDFLLLEGW